MRESQSSRSARRAVEESSVRPQHFDFEVSEAEFDSVLGRVKERSMPYWADPRQTRPGEVDQRGNGRAIYFAGDTCVFGDMELIRRVYAPDYAVLPIGDFFTMGPREAALALELLGNPPCIPCHYGTFPVLTGTPDQLRTEAPSAIIHELEPGGSLVLT